jgi:hypothetical protein
VQILDTVARKAISCVRSGWDTSRDKEESDYGSISYAALHIPRCKPILNLWRR